MEEILGHEILDETDAFVDGTHQVKVTREEGFEWAKLRLLGSKIVDERLSYSETKAITAHLLVNYIQHFSMLTENQVMRMVGDTSVTVFPTATRRLGQDLPDDLIYKRGEATNVCTLILSGKMTVITGSDEFRTDVGSWTLLGISALKDPQYKCDFEAFVCNGPCRCLEFTRESFINAMDASICEKRELKEDSFRNLELEKLQANAANSSAPSASEGASEAEESADTASDLGGRRRSSRRSTLLAALHIADSNTAPHEQSPSHGVVAQTEGTKSVSDQPPSTTKDASQEELETEEKVNDASSEPKGARVSFRHQHGEDGL